jgi:Antitoxin-like ribbon-helix-helix
MPFNVFVSEASSMIGKRVQFHEETWQQLHLLAADSMKSFQELADEAFTDLLRKYGRPANLKEALRRSAGESATIIPLRRKGPRARTKK